MMDVAQFLGLGWIAVLTVFLLNIIGSAINMKHTNGRE